MNDYDIDGLITDEMVNIHLDRWNQGSSRLITLQEIERRILKATLEASPLVQRLKKECERYGLMGVSLDRLLRHLEGNWAATRGALKFSINTLTERGVALYDALKELDAYDSADPKYIGSSTEAKVKAALDNFKHIKEMYERDREQADPPSEDVEQRSDPAVTSPRGDSGEDR